MNLEWARPYMGSIPSNGGHEVKVGGQEEKFVRRHADRELSYTPFHVRHPKKLVFPIRFCHNELQ